ncbi:MAG: TetR/AcrR family transcriptional regulator [Sneathiella sp.]|nr:TetR/AcrR family transcriptional regulator [Sneathiella sp.]
MKKRLSKTDWLDHGLRTLAVSGANSLKAEPLSRSLKVSRGSFYWHFKDIDHFQTDLLACWKKRATDDIIAEIKKIDGDSTRLAALMKKAMRGTDDLERAIRSWATENSAVAETVSIVDETRLAYLAEILIAAGVAPSQVRSRTAFIYWARLGQIMMDVNKTELSDADIEGLAKLLQS